MGGTGIFGWLGDSLFGASPYTPTQVAPNITPDPPGGYGGGTLAGLLDPRGIREQAAWAGLGALSQGLLAAGMRRPAGSPSPLPQALGAFGPAYQGALQSGYQAAGAEQQFRQREAAERTRLEREQAWQTALAAATPAERTLMQQMGPDQWAQMQGNVQAALRRPTVVGADSSLVVPGSGQVLATTPPRPDAPQLVRNDDGSLDIWYPPPRGGGTAPPIGGSPQAPATAPPGGAPRAAPPGMPGGTRPITPMPPAQAERFAAIGDPLAYPGGPHDPYRGWEQGQPDLPIVPVPPPERGAMPPTVRPGTRPPAAPPPTTAQPPTAAAASQRPAVPGLVQLRPPRPVDPTHLSGQALDAQMYNIYNTLDAAAAERQLTPIEQRALEQAERHLTAPRTQPDGTVIVPGELPSVRRQAAAAPSAPGAAPPAQGAAAAAPRQRDRPPLQPGMTRTETPGGGYIDRPASPQAIEDVRKAEVEGGRVLSAVDAFQRLINDPQGAPRLSAWLRNPLSPEAATYQQAYENMIMTLRSEAFANTGVMQGHEALALARQFLDPSTFRGMVASPEARTAQLNQLRQFVQDGINNQRRSIGRPPLEFTAPQPAARRPGDLPPSPRDAPPAPAAPAGRPAVGATATDSAGNQVRWDGIRWVPVPAAAPAR